MAKNIFLATALAYINGDTSTTKALKIQKYAISGLKTQIANMEGETISKQEAIDDAEEAFNKAFVNNGDLMSTASDRTKYVQNLIAAKERIEDANEALENHIATIAFLKEQLVIAETTETESVVSDPDNG